MVNTVIDLSHFNNVAADGFHQIVDAGITGIIHKATQGLTMVDSEYAEREIRARSVGLQWGAYHFGTNEDGSDQADYFLSKLSSDPTLMVLDFESNPSGGSMTVAQAEDFVQQIQQKTGHWPGFYSGNAIVQALGSKKSAILANCWLWSARDGPAPTVQATWSTWTMWQYTDGTSGNQPHSVPGVGNCDRDQFNGTADQLAAFWNANA